MVANFSTFLPPRQGEGANTGHPDTVSPLFHGFVGQLWYEAAFTSFLMEWYLE